MSRFTLLVLCFYVLKLSEVVGQDNDVCLTLPRNSVPTNQRSIQGVPGKQGPVGAIGPKGIQGLKGEPGDVESCGCNPGDIAELKEQVRALRRKQDSLSCAGGLIYNNQCIKLVGTKDTRVNFTKAEQACRDLDAALAEITSDEMFNQVYKYVQKRMIQYTENTGRSWTRADVWLGSKFEPTTSNTNNLITLRNGTKVRLGNWYPGYPYKGASHSTYVRLIMIVQSRDDSISRGIFNYYPTYTYPVLLCATQLPN